MPVGCFCGGGSGCFTSVAAPSKESPAAGGPALAVRVIQKVATNDTSSRSVLLSLFMTSPLDCWTYSATAFREDGPKVLRLCCLLPRHLRPQSILLRALPVVDQHGESNQVVARLQHHMSSCVLQARLTRYSSSKPSWLSFLEKIF